MEQFADPMPRPKDSDPVVLGSALGLGKGVKVQVIVM